MRMLSRFLSFVFVIVFALFALAFLSSNKQPHLLMFLDWKLVSAPVGIWILAGFALGLPLGWLISTPRVLGLRRQNKKMQKKLTQQKLSSDT